MRLEMLEIAGEVGVKSTGRLLYVCMQEGRIPKEWMMSLILPIWKRKARCLRNQVYRATEKLKFQFYHTRIEAMHES